MNFYIENIKKSLLSKERSLIHSSPVYTDPYNFIYNIIYYNVYIPLTGIILMDGFFDEYNIKLLKRAVAIAIDILAKHKKLILPEHIVEYNEKIEQYTLNKHDYEYLRDQILADTKNGWVDSKDYDIKGTELNIIRTLKHSLTFVTSKLYPYLTTIEYRAKNYKDILSQIKVDKYNISFDDNLASSLDINNFLFTGDQNLAIVFDEDLSEDVKDFLLQIIEDSLKGKDIKYTCDLLGDKTYNNTAIVFRDHNIEPMPDGNLEHRHVSEYINNNRGLCFFVLHTTYNGFHANIRDKQGFTKSLEFDKDSVSFISNHLFVTKKIDYKHLERSIKLKELTK